MQNLYLFYGNDQYSIQQEIKKWRTGFLAKNPEGANIREFRKSEIHLNTILTESLTVPFLSEKRLIICHNAYHQISQLKNADSFFEKLAQTPPSTVILFVETEIKKNSVFIKQLLKINAVAKEFGKSKQALNSLINGILKKHQKSLSSHLISELIYGLEENSFKIEHELLKLILYSQNSQITEDEFYEVIHLNPTLNIFKITDQISSKNHAEAFKTLNKLISKNEDPTMVFYLIAKHFRNLILVKNLTEIKKSPSEIQSETGLKPFSIQTLKRQIHNFDYASLERFLNHSLKIDKKIKTGGLKYTKNSPEELLFAMERLILAI